jgi:hypothetical protein
VKGEKEERKYKKIKVVIDRTKVRRKSADQRYLPYSPR